MNKNKLKIRNVEEVFVYSYELNETLSFDYIPTYEQVKIRFEKIIFENKSNYINHLDADNLYDFDVWNYDVEISFVFSEECSFLNGYNDDYEFSQSLKLRNIEKFMNEINAFIDDYSIEILADVIDILSISCVDEISEVRNEKSIFFSSFIDYDRAFDEFVDDIFYHERGIYYPRIYGYNEAIAQGDIAMIGYGKKCMQSLIIY